MGIDHVHRVLYTKLDIECNKGRIPRHRHPRDNPREDVGVGVVECGLKRRRSSVYWKHFSTAVRRVVDGQCDKQ